jgi:hypothetical protein
MLIKLSHFCVKCYFTLHGVKNVCTIFCFVVKYLMIFLFFSVIIGEVLIVRVGFLWNY